jgi:hypothetical protein
MTTRGSTVDGSSAKEVHDDAFVPIAIAHRTTGAR